MDKLLEQSLLYDFYGELLTSHQRSIYESFVFEDLSLGEIAQQEGISRQGVHDLVKRCDKTLREYEEKLHLVQRFSDMKERIEQIQTLSKDPIQPDTLDRIRILSAELLEEL
jgi:predicted DNA-binding protein YlxM (UPF0122 family)